MPEELPHGSLPDNCLPIQTGIGKVLAVSQVAKAMQTHQLQMIISVGFCGGLNGSKQGQLVMPTTAQQWDLKLGDMDIPLGHGYAMHCPVTLPEVSLTSVPSPVRGLLISGDRFVDSSVHVDKHAVAVDMETAALALLACELQLPFVSIREVSDVADGPQESTHQQFMEYIQAKGPDYSKAVVELAAQGPQDLPPPTKLG